MGRLDLLAVQGTLRSLLQHHTSKASIFWCSAFLTVQLSHPYMTTGKTTALTRRTFVGKVMSLLFNILSMLVTSFLPRSKRLLISWLQSPSAVYIWDHFNMKMTLLSPWKIFRGLEETPCVGRGPALFPPPLLTLCSCTFPRVLCVIPCVTPCALAHAPSSV